MAAVAMATLAALTPTSALAFALTGCQWAVDENGQACGPASPSGSWNACYIGVYYTSNITGNQKWLDTATTTLGQWQAYDGANSRYDFVYDDYSANRAQQVSMDAYDQGPPSANGTGSLGTASWSCTSGTNQLSGTSIVLNTDASINWCTVDDVGCPQSNQMELEGVTAHELGHTLGLHHPVTGPYGNAVMECYRGSGESSLVQTDDSNGEMYLYSGFPGNYGSPGTALTSC